jgi:hypothetical protein
MPDWYEILTSDYWGHFDYKPKKCLVLGIIENSAVAKDGDFWTDEISFSSQLVHGPLQRCMLHAFWLIAGLHPAKMCTFLASHSNAAYRPLQPTGRAAQNLICILHTTLYFIHCIYTAYLLYTEFPYTVNICPAAGRRRRSPDFP